MSSPPLPPSISVEPQRDHWRWAARVPSATLDGAAPNRQSAWKTAEFAAGALEAFARVERRRY